MTTIPTDATLAAAHAERVDRLASAGPLPTVDEIAGPIVRALFRLGDLANRTHDLELCAEFGPDCDDHRRQAFELVDLVDRVGNIVATAIESHMAGDDRDRFSDTVRGVIGRVADARNLRDYLYYGVAHDLKNDAVTE